jgi:hypothetical protein
MNVEGFGDGADGFPLLDEFEGQFLLITASYAGKWVMTG